MKRIGVAFPVAEDSLVRTPSETIVFGYSVATADGVTLAQGQVTADRVIHDYGQGFDSTRPIPEYFDVGQLFHPVAHRRLAKQCVAMALFDYDPENPGELTADEERLVVDEARGSGTFDNIDRAVTDYRLSI